MMMSNHQILLATCLMLLLATASSFQASPLFTSSATTTTTATKRTNYISTPPLSMSTETSEKKGYVPKWKKKKTLADDIGDLDFKDKGIKGTIPVVFKQGNDTKTTMAMPGQPLRDVATQAGQFIKYGCGKGECGTCEAMCNGKWVRPCMDVVPADADANGELVVQVKEIAKKAASSGTFFSVRSFLMGFWNNVLGMVGFVKYRRNAKQNWEERQEYEELIRTLTLEKRQRRILEFQQMKQQQQGGASSSSSSSSDQGGLSP